MMGPPSKKDGSIIMQRDAGNVRTGLNSSAHNDFVTGRIFFAMSNPSQLNCYKRRRSAGTAYDTKNRQVLA